MSSHPSRWIIIHVFLWRSLEYESRIPPGVPCTWHDYVSKVQVVTNQAEYRVKGNTNKDDRLPQ